MLFHKNAIRVINAEHRAVCWLAGAFIITFAALTATAGITVYQRHSLREENAVLIASDILALQDSMDEDGEKMAVYRALIDSRIGIFLSEREQKNFRELLLADEIRPLSDAIRQSIENNSFSARGLQRILEEFLSEKKPVISDTVRGTTPLIQKKTQNNRIKSAAEQAGALFGLKMLFRAADVPAENAAYCRNAYVEIDPINGNITVLAISCKTGEKTLSTSECRTIAAVYAREVQGMKIKCITEDYSMNGICYIIAADYNGNESLIGVREDTGGICLFKRMAVQSTG